MQPCLLARGAPTDFFYNTQVFASFLYSLEWATSVMHNGTYPLELVFNGFKADPRFTSPSHTKVEGGSRNGDIRTILYGAGCQLSHTRSETRAGVLWRDSLRYGDERVSLAFGRNAALGEYHVDFTIVNADRTAEEIEHLREIHAQHGLDLTRVLLEGPCTPAAEGQSAAKRVPLLAIADVGIFLESYIARAPNVLYKSPARGPGKKKKS